MTGGYCGLFCLTCRYLVDVIITYDEDGQLTPPDYDEPIHLGSSYHQGRKQNNAGCCGNEPNSSGVR